MWRRGREDAFPLRPIFCHRVSGVPLFWPWPKNFSSPLILIHGVRHKDFAALFGLDNAWSCTYELLTCGAITAVALVLWKGRLKSRSVEHFGSAEEVILRARRQFVRRSTAGGFKIAVLDHCSVVQSPAEIHTELNQRFPKIRLDIVRGRLSNIALIQYP